MKKEYTKEDVVNFFDEYGKDVGGNIHNFLKEKGLIEEPFIQGLYYKFKDSELPIRMYKGGGYGIAIDGSNDNTMMRDLRAWRRLSDTEAEEFLICEANKRGYENGNYICLEDPDETVIVVNRFFIENNSLWHGEKYNANCLLRNGEWAKILEGVTGVKEVAMAEVEAMYKCKVKIINKNR